MKPLTRDQESLLRGRDQEISEIVENCRQRRLTVVTSPPGMGVTSLLEAGVAPALRRDGFIVAVFRAWQGQGFAVNLKQAIDAAVREQTEKDISAAGETPGNMLQAIREISGKPVAVLFDQFEDYLRFHDVNQPLTEEFDSELAHALTQRDASFVIGMQAHAISAFERLKETVPDLLARQIKLDPLTRCAAKEAIESEAVSVGLKVEPAVPEALITAPVMMRNGDLVHPFFLKIATARLLDAARNSKAAVMNMAIIETSGSVDRLVLESLDHTFAALNPSHLELMFRSCNLLISKEVRRIAVTEKRLSDFAGKLNRFVLTLLPIMTEAGVLRSVEMADTTLYEIAREGLTPILRDWFDRRAIVMQNERRRAFLTRSISLAAACMVLMYVVYVIVTWKDA
jgi:hypothetical protein